MRSTFTTVAVALAVAGGFLAAGWSVQAAGLPPAAHADRVAADTAAWFLRYRLVRSTFRLDGRRESGLCLRGWFPRRDGLLARGTLLQLGSGLRIVDNGGPLRLSGAAGPERTGVPLLQLELAGCPAILGPRIAAAAQAGVHLRFERAFAAGGPALALRLPPQNHDRLTVDVRPGSYRPLAIAVARGNRHGVARVRLVRLAPALLDRLTALPERRPLRP